MLSHTLILNLSIVGVEMVELKEALLAKCGNLSNADILSSELWTHLKRLSRSRARTLQVIVVAKSELDCYSKQGVYITLVCIHIESKLQVQLYLHSFFWIIFWYYHYICTYYILQKMGFTMQCGMTRHYFVMTCSSVNAENKLECQFLLQVVIKAYDL